MARNNMTWIKGDITGDNYFDIFRLDAKDIQYLRLYQIIKGVFGSAGVKGLRVCVYGPMAELVYGHVRKGSRLLGETGLARRPLIELQATERLDIRKVGGSVRALFNRLEALRLIVIFRPWDTGKS